MFNKNKLDYNYTFSILFDTKRNSVWCTNQPLKSVNHNPNVVSMNAIAKNGSLRCVPSAGATAALARMAACERGCRARVGRRLGQDKSGDGKQILSILLKYNQIWIVYFSRFRSIQHQTEFCLVLSHGDEKILNQVVCMYQRNKLKFNFFI